MIVFDGYTTTSTKSMTQQRRAGGNVGATVTFTDDMRVTMNKDHFMANKSNKQSFINMFGHHLQQVNCQVYHNLVPRVLSLPPSRKYPGFGWSRVSLKQTAPHQGGFAFLQEAKEKANANLFKLVPRQRNRSH